MRFDFDSETRRRLGYRLIDQIDSFFSSLPDRSVQLPLELRTYGPLHDKLPENGTDAGKVLDELFREMVDQGEEILVGRGDLREFGRLLDESWKLKRSLSSKIAPAFVNEIYDTARQAGADGGKLLGAGGGGFMLIFVTPEKRASVLKSLHKFLPVPFQFERGGTQIVLYEPSYQNGH